MRVTTVAILALALLLDPRPVHAHLFGGEAPLCSNCPASPACADEPPRPGTYVPGDSGLSLTEGNLREQYSATRLMSAFGATVDFSLTYNSYRRLKVGLGDRWTHSYNIALFSQREDMFRMDGDGRVTKYSLASGDTYTAAPGYFETLTREPDGSFTLRHKHGTVFTFASVPDTRFRVQGRTLYRLTRIVDRNGNTTTLQYTSGDLTEIADTYGRVLTLTYGPRHKLASSTDPLGRTTTFTYDPSGRQLESITDPEGKTVRYTYDRRARMTAQLDKDGRSFSYTYARRLPVAIEDGANNPLFGLSNPLRWAIDRARLREDLLVEYVPTTTSRLDGRGNVWTYAYDKHGYLTLITAPDGATTSFTYDPVTLLLSSQTDANGRTTSYQYDANGNLVQQTDALGHVTTYTYEPVFNMMTSMTDPNGHTTTYEYDARGNRIRDTDPLGGTQERLYDGHGNLLAETDKNGNVTMLQYDAFGNLSQIADAAGNISTLVHDVVGNLLSRTDANHHTTTYLYDGLDRRVREIDPAGEVTEELYDGQGDRVTLVDRNGNVTAAEYDLRRRLTRTIDAIGQVTTFTYDGNDNRTSVTDANGHVTTSEYDVQNRLTRTTDALGNVVSMTYDGVGNKVSETDANGHTTTYEYDAVNRLVETTDAEANVIQLVYDVTGLPGCPACTGPTKGSRAVTKGIDANGKVTYFKYDALDRLILEIRKDGDTDDLVDATDAVTRHTYDPQGNQVAMVEPNGNTTTYVFDALNREIRTTNAAGDTTLTTYNPVGSIATVTAPNLNTTVYAYDTLERLVQVDDSVGRVATYTYDAVGNRLAERDGNGNGTTNAYDALHRVSDVTDALGHTTRYEYDPVGNLLRVTDREGQVTTHDYDAINRRTSTTDAQPATTTYGYDAVGNVTRITDANGHATSYEYDRVNRLVQVTHPDPAPNTVRFAYDGVGNIVQRTDQKGQITTYGYGDLHFPITRSYPAGGDDTMTYDLSGRLLSACREGAPDDLPVDDCPGWLVEFEYDGANRVTRTTQNGQTVAYVHDVPGRTRTLVYPGGRTVVETTDLRARLDRVDGGPAPPLVQYAYDLGNRVTTRDYRNGTTAAWGHNANGWITALTHTTGPALIAGFAHDHDDEGNKRFERRDHEPSRSESYQHDDVHRLIDFRVGTLVGSTVPVPSTRTQYDLDRVGNWDTRTTDGSPEARTHNAANEILTIGGLPVGHDDNGNLDADERYTYAYDEENRLVAVRRTADAKVVAQHDYDALSRRVQTLADPEIGPPSPTATRYFYDDARIVEEQDAGGATEATYVYGNYVDEVLTMDRAGATFYYHQNALWSVAAVTDAAGAVAESYAYDAYGLPVIRDDMGTPVPDNPWGTPHSAVGNPWLFTGRQLDEPTGLYAYRARHYDAAKGRFLQREPIGVLNLYPRTFTASLYLYANDSPTRFVDPLGEDSVTIITDAVDSRTRRVYREFIKDFSGKSTTLHSDLSDLDQVVEAIRSYKDNQITRLNFGGHGCRGGCAFHKFVGRENVNGKGFESLPQETLDDVKKKLAPDAQIWVFGCMSARAVEDAQKLARLLGRPVYAQTGTVTIGSRGNPLYYRYTGYHFGGHWIRYDPDGTMTNLSTNKPVTADDIRKLAAERCGKAKCKAR
jgi:RHS repeat-associated protein